MMINPPHFPPKACDYARLPHSGGGTNHGPAIHLVRGYEICDKCYDAMVRAEKQWDEANACS